MTSFLARLHVLIGVIAISLLSQPLQAVGQPSWSDIEANARKELKSLESRLPQDHRRVADVAYALADSLIRQEKFLEAEPYLNRVLPIYEAQGDLTSLGAVFAALGWICNKTNRPYLAKKYHISAINIREKIGSITPDVLFQDYLNLAVTEIEINEDREAQTSLFAALSTARKRSTKEAKGKIDMVERALVRVSERIGDYRNATIVKARIVKRTEAPYIADIKSLPVMVDAGTLLFLAEDYRHLSDLYSHTGDKRLALDAGSKALEIYNRALRERPDLRVRVPSEEFPYVIFNNIRIPEQFVKAAWQIRSSGNPKELDERAFEAAQAQRFSAVDQSVAIAMSIAGARMRGVEDLALRWHALRSRQLEYFQRPASQADDQFPDDGDMPDLLQKIEAAAPGFYNNIYPRPLTVSESHKILGSDEAIVLWLVGSSESYVFALTKSAIKWYAIDLNWSSAGEKIEMFRRGLDVGKLQRSVSSSDPELFDLGMAYQLYKDLFPEGVDALIREKHHVILIPTGPLTSLPFHLLLTRKPEKLKPKLEDIGSYSDAAWLIRRHSLSVLPSLASLKSIRRFSPSVKAAKALIGFGAPIFDPARPLAATSSDKAPATVVRGYSEYWKGASVDRSEFIRSLPPLPETADELRAVAKSVAPAGSDIYLGHDASETMVKRVPLADYDIVYFATHGLVAGELKGLGEPALALTLPKIPTEGDDGLLTASEIAQLRLNADWVVLSACNTAAADKPGAEALSGLARAFFSAGARALLVSHWSVDSAAAVRLTSSTFDALRRDGTSGRAEALRRSMLSYLDDKTDPWNSYPAFWGAFTLVGDGAGQLRRDRR